MFLATFDDIATNQLLRNGILVLSKLITHVLLSASEQSTCSNYGYAPLLL